MALEDRRTRSTQAGVVVRPPSNLCGSSADPGLPHMNPSPPRGQGDMRKTETPLFLPSFLSRVGSFKVTLLRDTGHSLHLSCFPAQLAQPMVPAVWAGPSSASPPSTHLPIDKAVQRDPCGPHIQGLERNSSHESPKRNRHTPCSPSSSGPWEKASRRPPSPVTHSFNKHSQALVLCQTLC